MKIPADKLCSHSVKCKEIQFVCFQVCFVADALVFYILPVFTVHTVGNRHGIRHIHSGIAPAVCPEVYADLSCTDRFLKLQLHPLVCFIMSPCNPASACRAACVVDAAVIDSADRIISVGLHPGSFGNRICTVFPCNIGAVHFLSLRYTNGSCDRLCHSFCLAAYRKAARLGYLVFCNLLPGYRKLFLRTCVQDGNYGLRKLRKLAHSGHDMDRTDAKRFCDNELQAYPVSRILYGTFYSHCPDSIQAVRRDLIPGYFFFFFSFTAVNSGNLFRKNRRLALSYVNRIKSLISQKLLFL